MTLEVAAGEAVAVMGPSGSKSTLLNQIAGLDKPTSGTVTVAGPPVSALGHRNHGTRGMRSCWVVATGFGVANIMVISVLERRSEIGLRRALGAAILIGALAGLWPALPPPAWHPPRPCGPCNPAHRC